MDQYVLIFLGSQHVQGIVMQVENPIFMMESVSIKVYFWKNFGQ